MSWVRKIWGSGILQFVGLADPADASGNTAIPVTALVDDQSRMVRLNADGSVPVAIVSGDVEETLWTDDTNAYFVRHVNASSVTWTDVSGNPSSGPGTGARPAAATSGVVDRSSWQATANGTGISIGDLLDHFVVTNPTTGAIIGHFWINSTTEAKLASAPSAASITPISTTPAPTTATTTIADTQSLSGAIVLDGRLPCGFYIPASFEGGYIQFARSYDGVNFFDVYDEYGAKRQMVAPSPSFVQLANPAEWLGAKAMKIRSVTSAGAAQAQSGNADIVVPLQG